MTHKEKKTKTKTKYRAERPRTYIVNNKPDEYLNRFLGGKSWQNRCLLGLPLSVGFGGISASRGRCFGGGGGDGGQSFSAVATRSSQKCHSCAATFCH